MALSKRASILSQSTCCSCFADVYCRLGEGFRKAISDDEQHKSNSRSKKAPREGARPDDVGVVKEQHVALGRMTFRLETWPDFRIGGSVWPSGMLLAHALADGFADLPKMRGLRVAELGAGPGLPGLVCGRLGAAEVALTDRADLVPLMSQNIHINELGSSCRAEALDWPHAASSPLAADARVKAGLPPLDVVLAADVVYFEEQDPLVEAMVALMAPHTVLVLAYKERTAADRMYLNKVILPKLECTRMDFAVTNHGACEIYIGKLRETQAE